MVEKNHPQLSVRRQSELLAVNRNRLKAERASVPRALSEADAQVARRMDELYLRFPEFGARRMSLKLTREGYPVSRRRGRVDSWNTWDWKRSIASPARAYPGLERKNIRTC
jgi:putative transposase